METGERQNLSLNHPQIKWNQTSHATQAQSREISSLLGQKSLKSFGFVPIHMAWTR